MNLIGKILVTLIFVMSLVFLGFAVTVYATHQNWKLKADNFKKEIANLSQQRNDLQTKLDAETKRLQEEIKASQELLAKAQSKRDELVKEVAGLQEGLSKKDEEIRQSLAAAKTANENLAAADGKVEKLREEIQTVRTDRDKNFQEIVRLTAEKNGLLGDKKQLDEINTKLAQQLAKAKLVLDRNSLSIETNVDGIPPKVDGIVLQVANDLVELSLGSDDGIAQGHTLDVSRSTKYVGRLVVIRTTPDKSVGKVLPEYLKGKIERDDRVATRLQ